jgi:hypothetical protein
MTNIINQCYHDFYTIFLFSFFFHSSFQTSIFHDYFLSVVGKPLSDIRTMISFIRTNFHGRVASFPSFAPSSVSYFFFYLPSSIFHPSIILNFQPSNLPAFHPSHLQTILSFILFFLSSIFHHILPFF